MTSGEPQDTPAQQCRRVELFGIGLVPGPTGMAPPATHPDPAIDLDGNQLAGPREIEPPPPAQVLRERMLLDGIGNPGVAHLADQPKFQH